MIRIRIFYASILTLLSAFVQGQAGALDPTFGNNGIVTTDFGNTIESGCSIALQADGKIVVAGNAFAGGGDPPVFALARYEPDGMLDLSFDADGKVQTDFGGTANQSSSIALQMDGKIIVVGAVGYLGVQDFGLARYNTNGELDSGFGTGGLVMTSFGSGLDGGTSIVVQPDEKIVVAGCTHVDSIEDFALARYNADGSLDTGFGVDGKVTTDFTGGHDCALTLALQQDGKMVVAGVASDTVGTAALARYNVDGSLDTTFDSDGRVNADFGYGGGRCNSITLQPDGRILVAGDGFNGNIAVFAIARFEENGALDTSFGINGLVQTDFGNYGDFATSIALQPDGMIVVAGYSYTADAGNSIVTARYNVEGALDISFGTMGLVMPNEVADCGRQFSIALQSDGKILVAGNANYDFMVARFYGSLENVIEPSTSDLESACVFPNPVSGSASLEYDLGRDEVLSIGLLDAMGRNVRSIVAQAHYAKGKHFQAIDMDGLDAGEYVLLLSSSGQSVRVPILKL